MLEGKTEKREKIQLAEHIDYFLEFSMGTNLGGLANGPKQNDKDLERKRKEIEPKEVECVG